MNKLAIAAAAVAFAALATPALAQDYGNGGNWYANLGYTHFDTNRGDLGGVTGRLGYNFSPHLGAEAEYSGGVSDDTFGKLNNAWGVYGVGRLPVSSNFDVFARVGYQQLNVDGRNGASDQHNDGAGFGAGAEWHATQGLGIRGEYTRLDNSDADTWSLSGTLHF